MTDPYTGQVQIFGFNYPPYQWAFAGGQTFPISQNAALFSLLGTYYGGNGQSTFQIPNLVNRLPVSQGQAPGLSQRDIGETFGEDSVAVLSTEMPAHVHSATAYSQRGTTNRVGQAVTGSLLGSPLGSTAIATTAANTTLSLQTIGSAGETIPHDNHQPYLALNFCVALYGVYPSFN